MKNAAYALLALAQRSLTEPGWPRTTVALATAVAYAVFYPIAYLKGGVPPVFGFLNFFFILLAAATLALPGALISATVSGILLGPLAAHFISVGPYIFHLSWFPRFFGFELYGIFTGVVFGLLRHQSHVVRETTARFMRAQRMEAIGQFAASIAHDFNNILTVVKGFTELTVSEIDAPDIRDNLGQVLIAAEKGASLSHHLLAFSRRQIVQPSILDLNTIIRELAPMLERLAGENVVVSTALDPAPVWIKIDRSQMEQIIMNLTANARDAIPDFGRIVVSTRATELAGKQSRLRPEIAPGAYVQMSVADSGVGMSADVAAHVFEPFYTSKPYGTGLGLSTVYGIVKQSKGYIYFDSKPGTGTTFDVYLPAVAAARATMETTPRESIEGSGGSETILIVEDEEEVANFMRTALAARGYRVHIESSAEDALRRCSDYSVAPHVLITDVRLPAADGKKLSRELTIRFPSLLTLFVTGYDRDYDPEPIEARAGSALLQKPFGAAELLRAVRGLIGRVENE